MLMVQGHLYCPRLNMLHQYKTFSFTFKSIHHLAFGNLTESILKTD